MGGLSFSRFLVALVFTLFLPFIPAHAQSPDAVRSTLAPTGKLRAAIIMSNPVLVKKDPSTGAPGGVSVEVARELAKRIGVPLELVPYDNPAKYVESLKAISWDVGFGARDPSRAAFVDFSKTYMEVDNVFLVPGNSKLKTLADMDRSGVRIAASQGSAPDLFLTRTFKNVEMVRVPGGSDPAVEVLTSGKADAYGENAHFLSGIMSRIPGSRLIEGRFNVVQMAIAVPKGRDAAHGYLDAFVGDIKTSGFVKASIDRAGLKGVHPAPN